MKALGDPLVACREEMDECRSVKEQAALLLRFDSEAVLLRWLYFLESSRHDSIYVEVVHVAYQAGIFAAVDFAPSKLAFGIE